MTNVQRIAMAIEAANKCREWNNELNEMLPVILINKSLQTEMYNKYGLGCIHIDNDSTTDCIRFSGEIEYNENYFLPFEIEVKPSLISVIDVDVKLTCDNFDEKSDVEDILFDMFSSYLPTNCNSFENKLDNLFKDPEFTKEIDKICTEIIEEERV